MEVLTKSLPYIKFFLSRPDYKIIVVCNIYHTFVSSECVGMSSPSSVCLKCVSVCSCVWNASVGTRQGWHHSDGKAPGSDGWKVDAEAEVG